MNVADTIEIKKAQPHHLNTAVLLLQRVSGNVLLRIGFFTGYIVIRCTFTI